MSKIKINKLEQTASNLEVLNDQKMSDAVGGYYGYGYGGYSYSYSQSDYTSFKDVYSNQVSLSENKQTLLGGGFASGNNATNNVNQGNNANISL